MPSGSAHLQRGVGFTKFAQAPDAPVIASPTTGFVAAQTAASAPMIYIDPFAAAGGNGSLAHPYNNWNFGPLQAGTAYLQRAGTVYGGVIQVGPGGTADAPITIGAYGTGAAPLLTNTVDFAGASYASISGFRMTDASGASVVIQQGSSHIDVSHDTIAGSAAGIWIGNAAGDDIAIHDDTIRNAAGGGILVDSTASSAADPITIAHNLVTGSGGDGIQIISNHIQVADNRVSDNGRAVAGASGIQVYAPNATAGVGQDNIITGNVLLNNHDSLAQDGNGLLLDQWTSGNVVTDNFALGNDGAGIALYDSADNTVTGNVLTGNGLDRAGTHSVHADLVLNQSLGLTRDNVFVGNTALSFSSGAAASFVNGAIVQAGNEFSGDVFENTAGGDIYQIGGVSGTSLADWNTTMDAADRFTDPTLSTPAAGTHYAYRFASATTTDAVSSQGLHLVGWSASGGLFGT